VQVSSAGATQWAAGQTNQLLHLGDRLRTGERSRATMRLSDLSVLRVNELTVLQIREPETQANQSLLDMRAGSTYFFSRERPARQQFRTPLASGAIRGTEFNLSVAEDGRTVVTLVDGEVTLSNQVGQISMTSGEQGTVETGKAPAKTPMLEAVNVIQWCLYYPGVLAADDLQLSADERQAIAASLDAYGQGDLLQAVALYPAGRTPTSVSERVYRAATLLAVGHVDQAEALLPPPAQGPATARAEQVAVALREVVSVVKNQPGPRANPPHLSTELLAESYYFQAHGNLDEALAVAEASVRESPNFSFGWARVAELELSFGRQNKAMDAIETSLKLSPRNAQAFAIKGFILLSRNRVKEAQAEFEHAIALDGALGNAWLGRGLCKIRRGQAESGREDMQVAAVLEPQRAVLRSYLGKAFSNAGDNRRAEKELGLAKRFDPNDPTAWLYSALVEQQQNQINAAVRDLEKSEELNDNERLFRSKLLLDEDRAVRGANLAGVYQDTGILNWDKGVGMSDWGVREASRAVSYDYANFSAHQFLANSYDAFRDPRQINLRYETPWFSELLMANLLAPVGAGNLSEFSAQQANSRLFQQNHFGVSSDTEYLSHGDWLERGSQYGTVGPATYALDAEYHSERGWRANNDLEQFTGSVRAKDQITPQDSILVEGIYYDSKFGDVAQYYNQYGTVSNAPVPSATFRGIEREAPNVYLGYHHEWQPGLHTLALAGHLNDTLRYSDPNTLIPFTIVRGGTVTAVRSQAFDVDFDRTFNAYTAEIQQIWQTERQTMVVGGRYQAGDAVTTSEVNNPNSFPSLISSQKIEADIDHYSVYGYETIKLFDKLQLIGGVSYDRLRFPENIDTSPISTQEREVDQVSPKAGFIFSPWSDTHLRFAYTRSLGGVFFDQSVRLEPTQVAGFNQAFRSLIPESVVGLVPGTSFTTYCLGLEQSLKTRTYISIDAEILDSDADRTVGVITNAFFIPVPNRPGSTGQSLDFTEQSLVFSLNQLICDEWSFGARYRLSHAALKGVFTDISSAAADGLNQDENATFQQLILYLNYYHPCGFFSQFQSIWTGQHNEGYAAPGLPGDYFWQLNLYAGYRFLHRAAEVRVGLLNMTDQDYLLNPLNLYYDLPRGRTVSMSLKFYF
jgi:tetratricopeptide (TPR) repeat protein